MKLTKGKISKLYNKKNQSIRRKKYKKKIVKKRQTFRKHNKNNLAHKSLKKVKGGASPKLEENIVEENIVVSAPEEKIVASAPEEKIVVEKNIVASAPEENIVAEKKIVVEENIVAEKKIVEGIKDLINQSLNNTGLQESEKAVKEASETLATGSKHEDTEEVIDSAQIPSAPQAQIDSAQQAPIDSAQQAPDSAQQAPDSEQIPSASEYGSSPRGLLTGTEEMVAKSGRIFIIDHDAKTTKWKTDLHEDQNLAKNNFKKLMLALYDATKSNNDEIKKKGEDFLMSHFNKPNVSMPDIISFTGVDPNSLTDSDKNVDNYAQASSI